MNTTRSFTIAATLLFALLLSNTAGAQELSLQGVFAAQAEGEYDRVTIDAAGTRLDEAEGDEEDLEDNLGFDLQLTFGGERTQFGLRGAVLTADGEDSETSYVNYDLGGVFLIGFPGKSVQAHIILGGGASFLNAETDASFTGESIEMSGFGYHALGGLGMKIPLNKSTAMTANLVYHRLHIFEAEGELDGEEGGTIDITTEDLIANRILIMAGINFGL